jgi:hypothetical protein
MGVKGTIIVSMPICSLHVDEQGTIDASSSYFPIAFDDYVPGLIKVSTFARVLSLVLPSPEVQFPF